MRARPTLPTVAGNETSRRKTKKKRQRKQNHPPTSCYAKEAISFLEPRCYIKRAVAKPNENIHTQRTDAKLRLPKPQLRSTQHFTLRSRLCSRAHSACFYFSLPCLSNPEHCVRRIFGRLYEMKIGAAFFTLPNCLWYELTPNNTADGLSAFLSRMETLFFPAFVSFRSSSGLSSPNRSLFSPAPFFCFLLRLS